MKIKVWIVSTCVPGETEPCLPSPFGSEAEAEAYADRMLRAEWENAAIEDDQCDDFPPVLRPYPDNWREAQSQIKAYISDGSWGEWEITDHDVEIGMLDEVHDVASSIRGIHANKDGRFSTDREAWGGLHHQTMRLLELDVRLFGAPQGDPEPNGLPLGSTVDLAPATAMLDADGWQEWKGEDKNGPREARDTIVDWRLRNGEIGAQKFTDNGFWHHDGGHDDIVAWRYSDPHERAARAAGWSHGGDCDGIIYHTEAFDSWKEAVSWSGDEEWCAGIEASTAIYETWQECCEAEGIVIGGDR